MTDFRFPKDFIWGVAASAPQIEGAFDLDGKGLSIWDVYCRKPGTVAGGDTLDASVDHYHRYADDFRLMHEFGVKNYRLSISWARPDAVYWATRFTHELYDPGQIHIAENGLACKQEFDAQGQVQDLDRIAFLRENLRMLHRAVGDGLPVHACFHWTMFDNYEWMDGYSKKFGLVAVRDGSLERVPKLSAHWYREVMKANRVV